MENGVARRVIAARSQRWNSGRLESRMARVSPAPRPSSARPPAMASTRSRAWAQVRLTLSSLVRKATRSPWAATVRRKASAMDVASTAARVAVELSMPRTLTQTSEPSAGDEVAVGEVADVVGQADGEHQQDQGEAHGAGPLEHRERDRAAADLLGQRPEDVPAVQRQEGEQVDQAQRERDERQDLEGLRGALGEPLLGGLVAPDHARDLLALLGLEQA